jgi:Na+/H+ antiporter NhaD/arsenite permease-like protein
MVALLTALISVNGAVAALLPVVVVIAVRLKRNSAQLLLPLVFSAHAGSKLALTGSPVNVLASDAGSDAGVGGFGFFEFALVGVPLLAGTMAIIILFGFCQSAMARQCRLTSAAMQGRWSSNTASPVASTRCASAQLHPLSVRRCLRSS